jgi:ribonuclease Z
MNTFQVTIVGNNSATFSSGRHPSSQWLRYDKYNFLIDCAEGTQLRLLDMGLNPQKLEVIFISHLHGDHVLGLPGLLGSMSLGGRIKPLTIFGPVGLKKLLEVNLEITDTHLSFPLTINELTETDEPIYKLPEFEVFIFPLEHRVTCFGFLFRECNLKRKINAGILEANKVPFTYISKLRDGEDFIATDGSVVKNEVLTLPAPPARSYAYMTDTLYTEANIKYVFGVTVLYHEATFLHNELARAEATKHATALQAGEMAKKSQVNLLLIGHFSSRYGDLRLLEDEARRNFPYTWAARENYTFEIDFDKNY